MPREYKNAIQICIYVFCIRQTISGVIRYLYSRRIENIHYYSSNVTLAELGWVKNSISHKTFLKSIYCTYNTTLRSGQLSFQLFILFVFNYFLCNLFIIILFPPLLFFFSRSEHHLMCVVLCVLCTVPEYHVCQDIQLKHWQGKGLHENTYCYGYILKSEQKTNKTTASPVSAWMATTPPHEEKQMSPAALAITRPLSVVDVPVILSPFHPFSSSLLLSF